MKEIIETINRSITEKCNQLKNEVNMGFSSIVLPNVLPITPKASSSKSTTPPISYILYGVAGLSAIGAFTASDDGSIGPKLLGLGFAALCAIGGYRFSKPTAKEEVVTGTPIINLDSFKNDVSSKVISIVKNVSGEWDDFMQANKNQLQQAINNSALDTTTKDEMMNKVFIHEVFDIRLVDFNKQINLVNTIADLKTTIESFKTKLLTAIDNTAREQIDKYNLLLSLNSDGKHSVYHGVD